MFEKDKNRCAAVKKLSSNCPQMTPIGFAVVDLNLRTNTNIFRMLAHAILPHNLFVADGSLIVSWFADGSMGFTCIIALVMAVCSSILSG